MNRENHKPVTTDGYHHGDLRRALIDAALDLLTKEQNWAFSLREVARHAGVSHNAPYNHFADKRELLAAIATASFDVLREKMLESFSENDPADKALVEIGLVYIKFGLENPAHYRLMFTSEFTAGASPRPYVVLEAHMRTRELLISIIRRGAQSGVFAKAFNRDDPLQAAVLSAWSAVHGLTMLAIDGLTPVPRRAIDQVAKRLTHMVADGLKLRTS
jgi:AcrR family transcriptional regulator